MTLFYNGCATTGSKKDTEIPPFSAQGWGGAPCKELIHDITPSNVGFHQAVANIRLYQSWASGFVSGINYQDKNVYDISGGSTPEEIFAWLKNYCTEHQDIPIPIALHELQQVWKQEGKVLQQAEG